MESIVHERKPTPNVYLEKLLKKGATEVLSDADPVKMFEGVLVTNETSIENNVWLEDPGEETYTSIQIGLGYEHFTIENCFDFYTRKEIVEGRHGPHFSQRLFKTLPSLLLVQLQPIERGKDGTIVKINDQLILEEVLHFRNDWMVEDPSQPSSAARPRYSLMALVYHSGHSPHSGHYTAGVKRPDQEGRLRWFFCDDQNIQESTRTKIMNALPDNALCLILYKRDETLPEDIIPNDDLKEPTSSGALGHNAGSRANDASSSDDSRNLVCTKRSDDQEMESIHFASPEHSKVGEDFQNVMKISTADDSEKSRSPTFLTPVDMQGIASAKKSELIHGKLRQSRNVLPAEELLVLNDINSLSAEDAWSEKPVGLMKRSPSYINAGLQVLSVDPRVWKYVNDGVNFWTERHRFNMPCSQAFLDFMKNRRVLMTSSVTQSQSTLMPEEIIKYLSENPKLKCEHICAEFVTAMLSVFENELTDDFSPTKHLLTGMMMDRDDRTKQSFSFLALQPSSDFCQFEDCLTQFFEKVDEGVGVSSKKPRFYTLPSLLLIKMSNFKKPPSKPWKVLLDKTLVIKQDWLHESSPEWTSELPRFNLRAVVYRSDDDHYTAGVKLHDKSEWYLCDDEEVEETRSLRPLEERHPMNSVHLLLYKRHFEEN